MRHRHVVVTRPCLPPPGAARAPARHGMRAVRPGMSLAAPAATSPRTGLAAYSATAFRQEREIWPKIVAGKVPARGGRSASRGAPGIGDRPSFAIVQRSSGGYRGFSRILRRNRRVAAPIVSERRTGQSRPPGRWRVALTVNLATARAGLDCGYGINLAARRELSPDVTVAAGRIVASRPRAGGAGRRAQDEKAPKAPTVSTGGRCSPAPHPGAAGTGLRGPVWDGMQPAWSTTCHPFA